MIGSAVGASAPGDLLALDNQLCFALYAASRAMTGVYREFLDPLGITYPQYLALIVLYEEDGLTVTQIGDKLMLDSGTLTPLLKRLETMDLVGRARGTEDERTVHIRLTNKGYRFREPLLKARIRVGCSLGMSEDEISTMREIIMSIIGALAKAKGAAAARA